MASAADVNSLMNDETGLSIEERVYIARDHGISDQDIAAALGITVDQLQRRFGKLNTPPSHGGIIGDGNASLKGAGVFLLLLVGVFLLTRKS